jgi:hypothetical protein
MNMITKLLAVCTFFVLNFCNGVSQDGADFSTVDPQTGQTPSCYSFTQETDNTLDNFLRVNVGGEADVVLKLINNINGKCIRYVYIKAEDSFSLRYIPAGVYYVKIAYGNEWAVSGNGNECAAKFLHNNLYQIGNDLLDFNPVGSYDGMQIPSYELILRTYSDSRKNEFDAENISEEEFNK